MRGKWGCRVDAWDLKLMNLCPISLHKFIRFNNISDILRYLYEKAPHNNGEWGCRVDAWDQKLSEFDKAVQLVHSMVGNLKL